MYPINKMKCKDTNMVLGNSVNVDLCKISDPEIRADLVVNEINAKRIWGQIVNCEGKPMANLQVKLVRIVCDDNKTYYEGVAHTITDCEGFYQFDVCADDKSCYKVLTGKSVMGGETIIETNGGNCNPCGYPDGCNPGKPPYNPCAEQDITIMPYNPNACDCKSHHGCGCNDHHNSNDCGCNTNHQPNKCDCGCNCDTNHKKSHSYPRTNYASYNRL